MLGGRLFVIGGNDGSSFLNSCEVYDPVSNKWSFSAAMNRQRAGLGADVLDGLLYVSGNIDKNYCILSNLCDIHSTCFVIPLLCQWYQSLYYSTTGVFICVVYEIDFK